MNGLADQLPVALRAFRVLLSAPQVFVCPASAGLLAVLLPILFPG